MPLTGTEHDPRSEVPPLWPHPAGEDFRTMLSNRFSKIMTLAAIAFATPAIAETINVNDNHGGSVAAYDKRWAGLAARGVDVRVVGPCQSACTILIGHISARQDLCHSGGHLRLPQCQNPSHDNQDLEQLSLRHQRMDQCQRRPDARLQMDGRARYLQILQKVLRPGSAAADRTSAAISRDLVRYQPGAAPCVAT